MTYHLCYRNFLISYFRASHSTDRHLSHCHLRASVLKYCFNCERIYSHALHVLDLKRLSLYLSRWINEQSSFGRKHFISRKLNKRSQVFLWLSFWRWLAIPFSLIGNNLLFPCWGTLETFKFNSHFNDKNNNSSKVRWACLQTFVRILRLPYRCPGAPASLGLGYKRRVELWIGKTNRCKASCDPEGPPEWESLLVERKWLR